jgi:shikimate kinase
MSAPAHVVLIGMMGAGKTSVGRALAERLGVGYTDNDDGLRARTGLDAASVARQQGTTLLHRIEYEILDAALHRDDGAVIGAPASVALDDRAAALLAGHLVVWLRARPETLATRVRHDAARPLLGKNLIASLRVLAAEREPAFARLVSATVDVDGLSVDAVVDRVWEVPPTP